MFLTAVLSCNLAHVTIMKKLKNKSMTLKYFKDYFIIVKFDVITVIENVMFTKEDLYIYNCVFRNNIWYHVSSFFSLKTI